VATTEHIGTVGPRQWSSPIRSQMGHLSWRAVRSCASGRRTSA